jgi:hypothetical protein
MATGIKTGPVIIGRRKRGFNGKIGGASFTPKQPDDGTE